jgi:RNA polymerase sigma factor (sigma-70 family)
MAVASAVCLAALSYERAAHATKMSGGGMSDDDVLENNPQVRRSALEALHGELFGWALSRCNHDPHAAEDLMQQAYVELITGNARFDGRSSLKTFVFAIVENLANNRFRRAVRRIRLLRQHAASEMPRVDQVAEPVAAKGLWAAVEALPARQRDIVELVFCRELTIEEASRVMGISTGTGRVHYDRAKKALRAALGEEYADG